jgi:hypothetical protein
MPALTPIELGRRTVKDWQSPPHVQEFQKLYQELLYGNSFKRLALTAPVRHAKTWLWSWMGISAYIMNNPEKRVCYVSHAGLADEYGYKIRQEIETYGDLFRGVRLAKDTRSKTDFRTTQGGGLTCLSAGAAISGFGYDFILCDDLQKAQEELDSELQRSKVWRWFFSDLINRLTPRGRICCMMARRHPYDIIGMLKEHSLLSDLPEDMRWHFVQFRALNNGEALWPQEWSKERLEATQKDYELAGNAYLFNCLYLGDAEDSPVGLEWSGELFNGIEYDALPPGVIAKVRVCSLDPSKGKDAKSGDFAALVYLIVDTNGNVWVDDCRLVRQPGPELEASYMAWMAEHPCDISVIESDMDSGSMAAMITRRLMDSNRLADANKIYNLPSRGLGDKVERVRRDLSVLLCQKRLKVRRAGHYKLLLSQCRAFSPHSKTHDDGPDAVSMAVRGAIKYLGGTGKAAMKY